MKKLLLSLAFALLMPLSTFANGWPTNYGGVMLQAFHWDSFDDTQWATFEKQADELSRYFSLIWVPQSGFTGGYSSMGYDPLYYFNQNSAFGTEAELRSMIKTLKSKGTGVIGDVVINHRKNASNWVDFPAETYKGVTYQMQSTDICANDDGGKAKAWADQNGYQLSQNNDEGEDWSGMRDLDHKSENVQKIVKAYLKYLLEDIGYTGFRYDMVKGFYASRIRDYNDYAGVQYSIGEYWDSNDAIKTWINYTEKRSAAFDFQFKYNMRDAVNGGIGYNSYTGNSDWTLLQNKNTNNLINDVNYKQYGITFVENHDTQVRADGSSSGPLRADTLAANAFMLAVPGTPCVFLPHWLDYKKDIKNMIDVRKQMGITNTSNYSFSYSQKTYSGVRVTGSASGELMAVVGSGANSFNATSAWVEVLVGHHYKYLVQKKTEQAFANMPSGTYTQAFKVKLIAASQNNDAQLVYTTDGTTPTASSTKVSNGTEIDITTSCTLTVGLLVNGVVTHTISRQFEIAAEEPETFDTPAAGYTFTAYFVAPESWKKTIKAWVWDSNNGNMNYTGNIWPGENCYKIGKHKDGRYVWQWCYYGTLTATPTHIIFNNSGTPQTKDMTFTDKGWYESTSLAANPALEDPTVLAIEDVKTYAPSVLDGGIYNLAGQRVDDSYKGIVIKNGRKYMNK